MNKEKKKELAEMDSRWDFEKKVLIPQKLEADWDDVRNGFNQLQDDHGDVYMLICKEDSPKTSKFEMVKNWYRKNYGGYSNTVTFHHRQIYEWYATLADELDVEIGEAIRLVLNDIETIREQLDVNNVMEVDINAMGQMAQPKESKVSKDELQEMINDD